MSAVVKLGASIRCRLGLAMLGRRDDEAFRLASRLATAGDREAMASLAILYLLGRGCPADAIEGSAWLSLAAGGRPGSMAAEMLAIHLPSLTEDQQDAVRQRCLSLTLRLQSRHFALLDQGVL